MGHLRLEMYLFVVLTQSSFYDNLAKNYQKSLLYKSEIAQTMQLFNYVIFS